MSSFHDAKWIRSASRPLRYKCSERNANFALCLLKEISTSLDIKWKTHPLRYRRNERHAPLRFTKWKTRPFGRIRFNKYVFVYWTLVGKKKLFGRIRCNWEYRGKLGDENLTWSGRRQWPVGKLCTHCNAVLSLWKWKICWRAYELLMNDPDVGVLS